MKSQWHQMSEVRTISRVLPGFLGQALSEHDRELRKTRRGLWGGYWALFRKRLVWGVGLRMSVMTCPAQPVMPLSVKKTLGDILEHNEMWAPQTGFQCTCAERATVSRDGDYRQFGGGRLGGIITFGGDQEKIICKVSKTKLPVSWTSRCCGLAGAGPPGAWHAQFGACLSHNGVATAGSCLVSPWSP